MKHILLIITGASPQVLTETLFAIHKQGKSLPNEIYVITTQSAKPLLVDGLFNQGHFQQLLTDYKLPEIEFSEKNIWLIEDQNGQPVFDASTEVDQVYMADFITRKVDELTKLENTAIHASIAGGRKTMAFYLGYAMSLFGREQDTLSHVFVDESFEFLKDFWYPTPHSKFVKNKAGKSVDCKNANITLTSIPYVRMRNLIDNSVLTSIKNVSFSKTVASLNTVNSKVISLVINPSAKQLTFAGIDISLTAKEMAFYLWLLDQYELNVDRYFEDTTSYSEAYLTQFSRVGTDLRVFRDTFGIEPEDFKINTLSGLKPMEKTFVQQTRSRINKKLNNALPIELAEKLLIDSTTVDGGTIYQVNALNNKIKIVLV